VDYVDGKRAAVVVYRHGAHVINVLFGRRRAGTCPRPSPGTDIIWCSGGAAT
jgi:hypothetical protein